jgi:hypothetical protein
MYLAPFPIVFPLAGEYRIPKAAQHFVHALGRMGQHWFQRNARSQFAFFGQCGDARTESNLDDAPEVGALTIKWDWTLDAGNSLWLKEGQTSKLSSVSEHPQPSAV